MSILPTKSRTVHQDVNVVLLSSTDNLRWTFVQWCADLESRPQHAKPRPRT